mmetsp:Transcript_11330/g.14761  ORF Transcript_11330/g.14761 Transcript_11330/m.14761 type:complete len:297 (-) Transcript_11330:204-1094(-)
MTQANQSHRQRVANISSHLSPTPCAQFFDKNKFMVAAGGKENDTGLKSEADLRVELAAAYRIVAYLGWDDGIQNHLTVRIPGAEDQYLINSYGMGFEEVTASSLVKIDHEGNVLDPGSVAGAVNLAGFNIHGAIHKARNDAICVMHTHESNTAAVASMKCGFLPGMSQHAMLVGEVSNHKYVPTVGPKAEEGCSKMASDLGATARSLLLENHGVITIGETVAEALMRLFYITKACDVQVKALGSKTGPESVNTVNNKETIKAMRKGGDRFLKTVSASEFAHFIRIIDRVNPGYNDL